MNSLTRLVAICLKSRLSTSDKVWATHGVSFLLLVILADFMRVVGTKHRSS